MADVVFYAALAFWAGAQVGTWPRSLERENPGRIRAFACGHLVAAALFAWWWYLGHGVSWLIGGTVAQLAMFLSDILRAHALAAAIKSPHSAPKNLPPIS
jgi:hypothetical protein